MKLGILGLALVMAATIGSFVIFGGGVADAGDEHGMYRVTVHNLTDGQPFSPPVAATHRRGIRMFRVGGLASSELEAIAEDGNQIPMFDLFSASSRVTEAVNVGIPLTPNGTTVGGFTDATTFNIKADYRDRLSLATMLICTNDGVTGLNRARLPQRGSWVVGTNGYDAGTENNTENSEDLVDPCTGLGPVPLPGDPDGNENNAVDTAPHSPIAMHPNIVGSGELTTVAHGWDNPVAKVTVTRIDPEAEDFLARLNGLGEVPPVETEASGRARFELDDDDQELRFRLKVENIEGVTQAHIHLGPPNENGPAVAFLFGLVPPTGPVDGLLARGKITEDDLVNDLAGDFDRFVEELRNGNTYVNVHTADNPPGEIRGQIGVIVDDDDEDDEGDGDDDENGEDD